MKTPEIYIRKLLMKILKAYTIFLLFFIFFKWSSENQSVKHNIQSKSFHELWNFFLLSHFHLIFFERIIKLHLDQRCQTKPLGEPKPNSYFLKTNAVE